MSLKPTPKLVAQILESKRNYNIVIKGVTISTGYIKVLMDKIIGTRVITL